MRRDFTPIMSKSFQIWDLFFLFFPPRIQKIQKIWTLDFGKWGYKMFKWTEQMKKMSTKLSRCGDFTLFISKSLQIWDHFFPFFPLRISKI